MKIVAVVDKNICVACGVCVKTCPKNALLYILMNNIRALDGVPMEGDVELITLFAQSMNQVPVQGTVPFNIIEP